MAVGPDAAHELLDALLSPEREGASVEQRLLWRCARVGLPEGALTEIRRLGKTLDAAGWARVVALAQRHGMENLLFTHLFSAGLDKTAPAESLWALSERYRDVALTARRLEYRLEKLLPLLAEADLTVLPLKGALLARRYYGTVTLRPVTDIDLLTSAADIPRFDEVVRAAGFTPAEGDGDPLSGHTLRFRELRYRDAGGMSLEAHLTLCRHPAYARTFPMREIWTRARPTTLNGIPTLTLAPEDELRFLSLHYIVQHQASRLIWLMDIAELLRTQASDLDWEALTRQAIETQFAAPLAMALIPARAWLEAPVPEEVCAQLRAAALTRPERRAWVNSQAPMANWQRFFAQRRTLETAPEWLGLLRSGAASFMRRLQ